MSFNELFTPSKKCPQAFVKERVNLLTSEDGANVLLQMKEEYEQNKNYRLLSRQSETDSCYDRFSSVLFSHSDVTSTSTELAPYMNLGVDTFVSNCSSPTKQTEEFHQFVNLDDIKVVSASSSSDEESDESRQNSVKENILNDSGHQNLASPPKDPNNRHYRKLSYTLESPSPLLLAAIKDKSVYIGPDNYDNDEIESILKMSSIPVGPDTNEIKCHDPILNTSLNPAKTSHRLSVVQSLRFKKHDECETCPVSPKDKQIQVSIKTQCVVEGDERHKDQETPCPVLENREENLSFSSPPKVDFVDSWVPITSETIIQSGNHNTKDQNNLGDSKHPLKIDTQRSISEMIANKQSLQYFLKELSERPSSLLSSDSGSVVTQKANTIVPNTSQEEEVETRNNQKTIYEKQEETRILLSMKKELKSWQEIFTKEICSLIELQRLELAKTVQEEIRKTIFPLVSELVKGQNETRVCRHCRIPFEEKGDEMQMTHLENSSYYAERFHVSKPVAEQIPKEEAPIHSPVLNIPPTAHNLTVEFEEPMKLKFDRVSATVKGYLTRRLMRTEHVQSIIQTIKETTALALEIHEDLITRPVKGRVPKQDAQFFQRLMNQITAACHEFNSVFFDLTTKEKMKIIQYSRENSKQSKSACSKTRRSLDQLMINGRKISSATLKNLKLGFAGHHHPFLSTRTK